MALYAPFRDAGWSSLVARRAHNPKVVGSNPAPATILKRSAISSFIVLLLPVIDHARFGFRRFAAVCDCYSGIGDPEAQESNGGEFQKLKENSGNNREQLPDE